MGDAARERDQTGERQSADEPHHARVASEKLPAARLAPPTLGDEIDTARRHEEAVAIVDDLLERGTAVVDRENLRGRLIGFNQRSVTS